MKHILLAVVGKTPRVVSNTLWALAMGTPHVRVDEAHLVTTANSLSNAEALDGPDGAISRLYRDLAYEPPKVFIHVFVDCNDAPLQDIRTAADSVAFSRGIADLARRLTMDPDAALIASIAGGRKSMGFLLGQAMTLFARSQDRLTHVLLGPDYQPEDDEWYPAPTGSKTTDVDLSDVLFVRLRGRLTAQELRESVLDPEPLIQGVQARIEAFQVTLEINAVGSPMPGLGGFANPLASVLQDLHADAALALRILTGALAGDCGIRVLIECRARASRLEDARRIAHALADAVRHALETDRTGYVVVDCNDEPIEFTAGWSASLLPGALSLTAPSGPRLAAVTPRVALRELKVRKELVGDQMPALPVHAMVASGCTMELTWQVDSFRLTEPEIDLVAATHDALANAAQTSAGEFKYGDALVLPAVRHRRAVALLQHWKHNPHGLRTSLQMRATTALPDSLVALIANAADPADDARTVRVGSTPRTDEAGVLDLSCCRAKGQRLPIVVPGHAELAAAGMRSPWPVAPRHLRATGVSLGTSGDTEVRIGLRDRSQHLYVLGSTGTGKSTLLRNLVLQDITAGEGVLVLDPHGDLVDEVLENIPTSRAADVVLLDAADGQHPFGLNFLEPDRNRLNDSIAFIANELIAIFRQMYGSVPESMGPMFEQYFRLGVAVLLDSSAVHQPTFIDLLRFFADEKFRAAVTRGSQNRTAHQLMRMLERAGGDMSWHNVAGYVTNKFNLFVLNGRVRSIICQDESTVDFGSAMEQGKVVLVRLPKGHLGEIDVKMIGMLLLGKLLGAALARVDTPGSGRRPMNVYVDEFQNFVTTTIGQLMAETRKYGLRMVLANQSLTQLTPELRDVVLGNAANVLTFRVGPEDAAAVESFFGPTLDRRQLQMLPNHHFAARLLHDGAPLLPPFVIRSHEPLPLAGERASRDLLRACSRQDFTRSREAVEAMVDRRFEAQYP